MSTFQRESVRTVLDEGAELFAMHAQEELLHPDIPLDLNREMYLSADALGLYRVYGARQDGRLIGYAAYSVMGSLQHKTSKQASLEAFYVKPGHRVTTPAHLLEFVEKELRAEGVQIVRQHALPGSGFDGMLTKSGYILAHHEYTKRLDKE